MISNAVLSEKRLVQQAADKYAERGYDVLENPKTSQLPAFLRGYHPSLIALSPSGSVIVEVMSRSKVRRKDYWQDLRATVEQQHDWHLDLLVNNTPETESITVEEAYGLLEQSRMAAPTSPPTALLVAWSAIEAAMRALLDRYGVQPPDLRPATLIAQSQFEGLVSDDDYELLRDCLSRRTAIAHGFRAEVDAALVNKLIDCAERMLATAIGTDD